MILAVFVFSAQGGGVGISILFGGTELYLVCVTVFAATHVDLRKSDVDFSQSPIHKVLEMLLFPTVAVIAMFFGVVFLNELACGYVVCQADTLSEFEVPDQLSGILQLLFIPKAHIANFAIGAGVVTSLICGSLRLILISAELSEA